MKAMILAAGLGTRMRPLTTTCPKPLLPLLLQPMLDHLLAQLQRAGVREAAINLHHQAEQMARWLGDGRRWDMRLTLSYEPEILGTAGALKRVETLFQDAPFLMVNADILLDIDLQALWHWHCQRHAWVTMVLRLDPAAHTYGAVLVDEADRVRLINGRPTSLQPGVGEATIFTGLQVVDPRVLPRIPPAGFCMTTGETYPALLEDSLPVYGYHHTGYWADIGVPARYLEAHRDLLDGAMGTTWQQRLPAGSRVLWQADTLPGVTVTPPVVLGPEVRLAPGVALGPYAILGARCQLDAGAQVRDSVLWERVHVGAQAQVDACVLGSGVRVPVGSAWQEEVRGTASETG